MIKIIWFGSSSVIYNMFNTEKIIEISPGESCLLLQVIFSDGKFGSFFRIKLMVIITDLLIYFNLCVCN